MAQAVAPRVRPGVGCCNYAAVWGLEKVPTEQNTGTRRRQNWKILQYATRRRHRRRLHPPVGSPSGDWNCRMTLAGGWASLACLAGGSLPIIAAAGRGPGCALGSAVRQQACLSPGAAANDDRCVAVASESRRWAARGWTGVWGGQWLCMRPFEGVPALQMGSKAELPYKYRIWGLQERKDSQTRPPALRAPGQKNA